MASTVNNSFFSSPGTLINVEQPGKIMKPSGYRGSTTMPTQATDHKTTNLARTRQTLSKIVSQAHSYNQSTNMECISIHRTRLTIPKRCHDYAHTGNQPPVCMDSPSIQQPNNNHKLPNLLANHANTGKQPPGSSLNPPAPTAKQQYRLIILSKTRQTSTKG